VDRRDANLLGAPATGIQDAAHDALVSESGVDGTAVAALLVVRERPGQSIAQLAAALSLTHAGAVRSVNRLAQRRLATRGHGQDGRRRGLVLSKAGPAMTDEVLAARRRLLLGLLEGLPVDERACFTQRSGTGARAVAGQPGRRLADVPNL
jgi:DNA-binding MarR family transcriptional regulator